MSGASAVSLEHVDCLVCGSGTSREWATEHGYTARKCADCGLVFVSPRPTLASIDEAARTGMHATDDGEVSVTDRFKGIRVVLRRRLVRQLWPELAGGGPIRWLDVGAGHGELLLALQGVLPPASTLVGVEPNRAKAASMRSRGVTAVGSLGEVEGSFDVVSMMNVYSHLPDPREFLASLREVLEPGGRLILETGNGAELADRSEYPDELSLPDHLSFTGEPQLRRVLTDAGYEVLRVDRRRVDGVAHTGVSVLRRLRGHPTPVGLPYRSPFRFLYATSRRIEDPAAGREPGADR